MAAGKRRLAAPSLLHICGANLPVGGPVDVPVSKKPEVLLKNAQPGNTTSSTFLLQ